MNRVDLAKKAGLTLVEKRLGYHLKNNPNRLMPEGVRGITVHQTDNPVYNADAERHHEYLRKGSGGKEVSWHYTVDERQAIQHFRDDRITWHAANAVGNNTTIGIELCMDADNKGDAMMGEANYRKTLENGAKLVALKLVEHGLSLDKIYQHYDWPNQTTGKRKNCPSQIRSGKYGISWSDFLKMVEANYKILTAPEPIPEPVPFPVPQPSHPWGDTAPEGKLFSVRLWSGKSRATAEAVEKAAKALGFTDTYSVTMDDPNAILEEEKE